MSDTSNRRITTGLVALSSAAVLAVYATGYARTREAAERLERAAQRRQRPAPTERDSAPIERARIDRERADGVVSEGALTATPLASTPQPLTAPPPVTPPSATPPSATPAPEGRAASGPRPSESDRDRPSNQRVPPANQSAALAPAPAPPEAKAAAPASAPVAPKAQAATTAPPPAPAPPTAPAVEPTDTTNAASPVDQTPLTPPPVAERGPYPKDGTFYGWGTSRHGDIQAEVVIEDGHIVSAVVSQCLTRYSCSWIAPLPRLMLKRQKVAYDYVSGATESSDAYHDAVADALARAK